MEPFLLRVAERMLAEHGTQLHRVAVVLPSARAGLHLRKYLAQVAGTALWSPDIKTWDGFVEDLAGRRRSGDLEALFELFTAHRAISATPNSLDAFLAWAPTVLADINDAESHLLDLDRFYADLRALEGIEHWSLSEHELSEGQQRLVNYWHQQGQLHRAFVERLKAKNAGTAGTLARAAAARVQAGGELPWSAVWFAGLNAFTTAQQTIVDVLVRKGLARLCWDADRAYLDHPVHEAGYFLRKAIARSGEGLVPVGDNIRSDTRTVRVEELPTAVAMALHTGALLNDLTPEERSKTAVLLADETLLLPLLDALPADIGPVNVTMGLRLQDLPVHSLVEAFLELHRQQDRDGGYPWRDLEQFLRHPFLEQRNGNESEVLRVVRKVVASSIAYQQLTRAGVDRTTASGLLLQALEPVEGDAARIVPRLNALFSAAIIQVGHLSFEREQLHRMAGMHHGLQEQLAAADVAFDIAAYAQLHKRLAREQRIAFFGEPLQGLQIMGMLETRAIDHERIIVLSCNEGKLPPGSGQRTFVPFDVRAAHGLPLAKDGDALAAYTFHRLLQRATQVHLLHSTDSETGNGPSRYVAQIEADAAGTKTIVQHAAHHAPLAVRSKASIVVEKSAEVLERTRALLAKGISPSALSAFIRCPLDFHFRFILGMKEEEEVTDELGSNVLGTAVHEAMQLICAPLIGKLVHPADLRLATDQLPDLLRERIRSQRPQVQLDGGHARLQWIMASNAMTKALLMDADDLENGTELEYLGLEEELSVLLAPETNSLGSPVRFRGRIDRIERRNGIHRIMDIKTGGVRPEDLSVKSWDPASFDTRREKALQLACYAFMFLHTHPAVMRLHAGIVPMQKPSLMAKCMLQVSGEPTIQRGSLPDVEAALMALVSRMVDPTVPIEHARDAKHCAFCAGVK
ncbi:MAG: PD-(D/E)XK nuclease family protein [Flavobacteriales bacterium]